MTNFATRFAEATTSEEFAKVNCDVLRSGGSETFNGPIFALINFAAEMAVQGSERQRVEIARFMRTAALSIEANAHINHQPTIDGNVIPLKGAD
jgi:hypothetical protein